MDGGLRHMKGLVRDLTSAGQLAIAATGTLARSPGPLPRYLDGALVTVDRREQVSPLQAPVRSYSSAVHLCPDGHPRPLFDFDPRTLGSYALRCGASG